MSNIAMMPKLTVMPSTAMMPNITVRPSIAMMNNITVMSYVAVMYNIDIAVGAENAMMLSIASCTEQLQVSILRNQLVENIQDHIHDLSRPQTVRLTLTKTLFLNGVILHYRNRS